MHLKTSLLPPIPLLPSSRDTPRHQTPALPGAPRPCGAAGHAVLPLFQGCPVFFHLGAAAPSALSAVNTGCQHQGPPGSVFYRSYPTAGPGRANLEADLLPCTFFFFFLLLPSIFLRLLDSVFYNEVTCMANSINASQTGPVRNAPPGYTCTFHLRSRGCEWPSPRAP